MATSTTQQTGQHGEQLAASYLRHKGYAIVALNWRCKHGEIDLIAREEDTLVFVEVRTRHARTTESALESITPRKRERIVNSTYSYLHAHDLPEETEWRIDVIAIALSGYRSPVIDHVENAFDW